MTKEQEKVISWLNDRVKVAKSYNDLFDLGISEPDTFEEFGVHVFGILSINKLVGYELGLELAIIDRDDKYYPYKVTFSYKGVQFYDLLTMKEKEEIENAITSN